MWPASNAIYSGDFCWRFFACVSSNVIFFRRNLTNLIWSCLTARCRRLFYRPNLRLIKSGSIFSIFLNLSFTNYQLDIECALTSVINLNSKQFLEACLGNLVDSRCSLVWVLWPVLVPDIRILLWVSAWRQNSRFLYCFDSSTHHIYSQIYRRVHQTHLSTLQASDIQSSVQDVDSCSFLLYYQFTARPAVFHLGCSSLSTDRWWGETVSFVHRALMESCLQLR